MDPITVIAIIGAVTGIVGLLLDGRRFYNESRPKLRLENSGVIIGKNASTGQTSMLIRVLIANISAHPARLYFHNATARLRVSGEWQTVPIESFAPGKKPQLDLPLSDRERIGFDDTSMLYRHDPALITREAPFIRMIALVSDDQRSFSKADRLRLDVPDSSGRNYCLETALPDLKGTLPGKQTAPLSL